MAQDIDEFYLNIFTGEYREKLDSFDPSLQYTASVEPLVFHRDDIEVVGRVPSMFEELYDTDRTWIFKNYSYTDISVEKTYFNNSENQHWLDCLIEMGYSDLVTEIQELIEIEREIFLLVSKHELDDYVREEIVNSSLESVKGSRAGDRFRITRRSI